MLDTAFTLKEIGLFGIFVALFILIIYMIFFIKNLTTTIKHTNSILEDAKVMTDIAQKRTKDVDEIIDDVSDSFGGISNALKDRKTYV